MSESDPKPAHQRESPTQAQGPTQICPPPEEAIGTTLGRYKLRERVGEGGWGTVYIAEQTEPVRRRVALKVIKLGMDTREVIARFEAERQALAMMDHPNIAKVLDAGATESGRPYFVMELVPGIRITDYCDQANLSTKERLDLFIKVCQAIQHAHQKGIIHRDIKPSNILVTLNDGVPVPKVIDFGIAKATAGRLTDLTVYTELHQFIGTPAYMSPEQAEMSGLDIDTRSDIYSLGVLLYELLTSKTPFDGLELRALGIDAMRKTIREKEPPKPSTRLTQELAKVGKWESEKVGDAVQTVSDSHKPTYSPAHAQPRQLKHGQKLHRLISQLRGDLDWIVMKCLEKDRARRYDTANGLALDLKRHLENEPVVARPPTAAYRMRKAFRRNKLLFTAGAAVLAALLLGLGVSLWQSAIAVRERDIADAARRAQERLRREAVEQRDAATGARKLADEQRARANEERARAEARENDAQLSLYAAKMDQVQKAWYENNIERVRQLLDETADYRDREFEWYFWQRQSRLAFRTLRGHLKHVKAVAYSPDGRLIASTGEDRSVKMWDAQSGQELWSSSGHAGLVHSLAFSPDGEQLVTGSWDHTAKVWDVATGRVLQTLKGHRSAIWSVAFTTNGLIATGSSDNTAMVWHVGEDRPRRTLKHAARVISVDFSSTDGHRLVTSSRDGTVKVWDALSGEELHDIPIPSGAFHAKFFPDGTRLVTVHPDQTARVWEVATGKELLALRGHGPGWVMKVAISRDGRRIVTASHDNTAKVWDAETGDELLTLKGHSHWVRSVDISPDGDYVVTGSHDGTAKVWKLSADKNPSTILGHTAPVRCLDFSRDGEWIVTGSEDQTAVVWNARSRSRQISLRGHNNWVSSVAFAPDGDRIATGSEDHTARIWNAVTGHLISKLEGHTAAVYSVAFSLDGQRLVTGSADHSAVIWDTSSGRRIISLEGHSGSVWTVAFSPDGRRILTGSEDGTAIIWDAVQGRPLHVVTAHHAPVRAVAYDPDGERFVTASVDGSAIVWDAATGTNKLAVLRGHRRLWSEGYLLSGAQNIWSAAFSPSGRRIVTGGDDGTVRVWDASSGLELLALQGPGEAVLSVAFSRNGSIAAGSADHKVWMWELASPDQLATWQKEEQRAGERLATLEREAEAQEEKERELHARDPGAIKQWLILGPIRLDVRKEHLDTFGLVGQQHVAEAMEQEQIPEGAEGFLPREGDRVELGDRQLVWQAARFEDHIADFGAFFGRGIHWRSCVGYAVCYIDSETDQTGLQMRIGWTSFVKVHLNGALVYRSEASPSETPDAALVQDLSLNRGRNVLILKLADEIGEWRASIRFLDAAGNPVQGIRVTLDPSPEKEQ